MNREYSYRLPNIDKPRTPGRRGPARVNPPPNSLTWTESPYIGKDATQYYYTSPRLSAFESDRLRPMTQTTLVFKSTPYNVPTEFLKATELHTFTDKKNRKHKKKIVEEKKKKTKDRKIEMRIMQVLFFQQEFIG